jgi:hypothetical protein
MGETNMNSNPHGQMVRRGIIMLGYHNEAEGAVYYPATVKYLAHGTCMKKSGVTSRLMATSRFQVAHLRRGCCKTSLQISTRKKNTQDRRLQSALSCLSSCATAGLLETPDLGCPHLRQNTLRPRIRRPKNTASPKT